MIYAVAFDCCWPLSLSISVHSVFVHQLCIVLGRFTNGNTCSDT